MRPTLLTVLVVAVMACGDAAGPQAVSVRLSVSNTGPDTLLAWWWRPDGTWDVLRAPPFVVDGPCVEAQAIQLAAWQGERFGHTTLVSRPTSGSWVARNGDSIPRLSMDGPPSC